MKDGCVGMVLGFGIGVMVRGGTVVCRSYNLCIGIIGHFWIDWNYTGISGGVYGRISGI